MDKGIEYILEVARCEGITKAANNLYITPSALSKYVQAKEEEIGVKLFHRIGKRFVLTQAGEYYVEKCREIEKIQYDLVTQMKTFSSINRGEIRLGVQPSFVDVMVKNVIPQFKKNFPEVRIVLLEYSVGHLLEMLLNRQLDIVVSTIDRREPGIECVKLCDCELILAVSKEDALVKKAVHKEGFRYPWIHLEKFADVPYVALIPGSPYRLYSDNILDYYGVKPQISYQLSATRTALSCVANGGGVLLTLDKMVQHHIEADKIAMLSVGEWPLKKELAMMYSEKNLLLEEVKHFVALTQKYI